MRILNRWEPNTLREQINRAFADVLERTGEESNLTTWAPRYFPASGGAASTRKRCSGPGGA